MFINDSSVLCSWPHKVEYWVTSDGRDFKTEEDALYHQKMLDDTENFQNCIIQSTKSYE